MNLEARHLRIRALFDAYEGAERRQDHRDAAALFSEFLEEVSHLDTELHAATGHGLTDAAAPLTHDHRGEE